MQSFLLVKPFMTFISRESFTQEIINVHKFFSVNEIQTLELADSQNSFHTDSLHVDVY